MRINVYQEELVGGPEGIELVTKHDVIGADGEQTSFYGVRFWLHGPELLHQTQWDDDRPAVTFWFGSIEAAAGMADLMQAGSSAIVKAMYAIWGAKRAGNAKPSHTLAEPYTGPRFGVGDDL